MEQVNETIIYRVLNNQGTAKEAKDVAQWLATPEGQEWLAIAIVTDAEMIEKNILPTTENIPTEEMLKIILNKIRRRQFRRTVVAYAAVLIPCFLMVALWLNLNERIGGALLTDSSLESIMVDKGKKKEVVFQDGSSVVLNSCSSIKYPHRFGLAERRIELEGEAYFDIESNKLRPFVVEMNDGTEIRVLGTQFNVSAYNESNEINITLIDGSIEFKDPRQTILMSADEHLKYDRTTKAITVSKFRDSERITSWIDDILYFRDTPLSEVLATLERRYDVKFQITDASLPEFTYSMKSHPGSTLESVLNDLESISSVRFTKQGNTYIVSRR